MLIPDICVTTQKKLSFTCEMTIAPEQMAVTARAFSIGLMNPSISARGAMMEAVVTMATVDEPCEVLSAAAMMKGIQIPRFAPERASFRTSAMPESLNTLPKEPPAAVIIIITAAELRDFPTHPPVDSISLLNLAGSVKDKESGHRLSYEADYLPEYTIPKGRGREVRNRFQHDEDQRHEYRYE